MTEQELKSQNLDAQTRCWRDPFLVSKLLKVRLREIKEKQNRAKKVVSECMSVASAVLGARRNEMSVERSRGGEEVRMERNAAKTSEES